VRHGIAPFPNLRLMVVTIIDQGTDKFFTGVEFGDEPEPYPPGVARPARSVPRALVDDWPHEPSNDPVVEVARTLAHRVEEAMDGRSAREVGRLSGVDYSTISAILNGTTWPDLVTLAKLEARLKTDLWPAGVAVAVAAHRRTPQ